MNHDNRGRLTVDLGGNWRLYANNLPVAGKALGLVTKDEMTGALVHIESTGVYVRLNAGAMVALPQAKVQAAIDAARAGSHGGPGRGQGLKAADGATGLKRTNITIDDDSKAILRGFGDGDLSLGIRRAAAHLKNRGRRNTMETKTTMAQQLAASLNNDGQCWIDADGCDFEEIAVELGATVEYAQRTGEYNDAGEMIYTAGSRSSHIADDPVRYAFPDGSAIIAAGDAWDFEGKTPFSWAGSQPMDSV